MKTGEIHDGGIKEELRQSINAVPGKARHEGFHLAFFARCGEAWIQAAEKILVLVGLLCFFPKAVKDSLRWPIPKKLPGEVRPLMLCSDWFAFLSAVMGNGS